MTSIPVTFTGNYGGIVDTRGLLSGDGPDLVVEYQTKYLGYFQGRPKTVRIPLSSIESVRLRKGWFGGSTLIVQAKTLAAVASLPEAEQGRVELKVARRDRALAQKFVDSAYE
ncbi:MAG: hypothetical protein U0746_22600 [Gemmataceae bacterium]